ncbi:MAG: hypothetical protein JRH19_09145 [Deltaproteobacteria bacterium]|nr:hypothetical protein [Deltaproteobacteria bacterium]
MSDSHASHDSSHDKASEKVFIGARLCDVFVLGFGAWTLLANAAVFLGGNLRQLEAGALATALALAAASVFVLRGRRQRASACLSAPAARARALEASAQAPPASMRLAVAVCALVVAGLHLYSGSDLLLWGCSVALLLVLAARELVNGNAAAPAQETLNSVPARAAMGARQGALLLGLCLTCAALTLLVHRADPDDAFYLNIAVAAADRPAEPLIAYDTLHGLPEVPLSLPVYRVHAVELLVALGSHRSGVPVLTVAHLWLPALMAFLVPLAWARLLRLVMPRAWLWGVFFCVAYLLLAGGSSHGHGSFSFLRLQQGKAVMLTLCIPLVIAYGIEFALAPGARRWLRLAAAQIAAVGMSASALWLAPATAALALSSARPFSRSSLGGVAQGLTASLYPLLLALALRGATESAFRDAAVRVSDATMRSEVLLAEASKVSLGRDGVTLLVIFALLGGWSVATSPLMRRLCVAFGLAFLLIFWSPLTASWVASHVTSGPTYWRVFWLLPLPLLVAVVLSAPISLLSRREPTWLAPGVACLVAALVLGLGPAAYTFSESRGAWIGAADWKLPPPLLDAALATVEHAGPGDWVLAPKEVAPWIPAFHQHPTPLVVRASYLPLLIGRLDSLELERRVSLMRLVTGIRRPAHAEQLLEDAVRDYPLQVVVLSSAARRWPELAEVLERQGMARVQTDEGFEVWARGGE